MLKQRTLVVDQEHLLRDLWRDILSSGPLYHEVTDVADTKQAWLRDSRFDFLVTAGDGAEELIHEARQRGITKILVLSGHLSADEGDKDQDHDLRRRLRRAAGDASIEMLPKPTQHLEIQRAIQRLGGEDIA